MSYKDEMDRILEARRRDPGITLRLLREFRKKLKLNREIERNELQYLQAFSDTYMCEAYLQLGDIQKARETGIRAMKVQLRGGMEKLLLITYNLLGYISGCMMNYVAASTYFCAGLELANQYNDYEMIRVLNANFGIAYVKLQEYEKARDLFEKSRSMADKLNLPPQQMQTVEAEYYQEMSEYYIGIGDYENAVHAISKVTANQDIHLARVAAAQGKIREAEIYIGQFLNQGKNKETLNCLSSFEIYQMLVEVCLSIQHQHYTTVCLDRLLSAAKSSKLSVYMAVYYDYMIKAVNLFAWEMKENYYELFYQYDQQSVGQREENERMCLKNELEIYQRRKRQKVIEKKNEQLRLLSQMDELTKTMNRNGFQEKLFEFLSEAEAKQVALGFCMIDIDHFKEINDSYGHLFGDECLKSVAGAIRSAFGNETVICRYGGDEFVVLSLNLPDDVYLKSLDKLRKHKKLKLGAVQITLSIGAVNCIPKVGNTDTDFIHHADKLLYHVKTETRNNYLYNNTI